MSLRSYRIEAFEIVNKEIMRKLDMHSLRKLVLYPTELRGHSASYITQPIPKVHRIYPFNNDVSRVLTIS